jgi:hypothetical protein
MCVWSGPRCLRSKYPLAIYKEYSENTNIEYLFQKVLGIGNATASTNIEELKYRKNTVGVSSEDVSAIYEELSKAINTDEAWKSVR